MLFSTGVGSDFKGAIRYLEEWGLFDAFLPFLLIFTIIFALLQQIKIFKTEADNPDNKINGIIAFSISALIVLPHVLGIYEDAKNPIIIMNKFLPATFIILIVILMIMFLTGLIGAEVPSLLVGIIAIVGIIILLVFFVFSAFPGLSIELGPPLNDPGFQALIVILVVFGLVVYFITKKDDGSKEKLEGVKKLVGKLLGGV